MLLWLYSRGCNSLHLPGGHAEVGVVKTCLHALRHGACTRISCCRPHVLRPAPPHPVCSLVRAWRRTTPFPQAACRFAARARRFSTGDSGVYLGCQDLFLSEVSGRFEVRCRRVSCAVRQRAEVACTDSNSPPHAA